LLDREVAPARATRGPSEGMFRPDEVLDGIRGCRTG
jgi:hypothetical protein